MDLTADFKKILRIFSDPEMPQFNQLKHHYPCSKEWFIDIKNAILDSPKFETDIHLPEIVESAKNLISHIPAKKNLMLAELEIKKAWNSYEITKKSWEFLFSKTENEIIYFVKKIARFSAEELIKREYPFKDNKDKMKMLKNLKNHICFYKDYRKSYDTYTSYYCEANYNLFQNFLSILKNLNSSEGYSENIEVTVSDKSETAHLEEIINGIESETLIDIERGKNILGEYVSGPPKWEGENLTELIKNIDDSVREIFDSISEKLVFPESNKSIKNMSGLYVNKSLLTKILNLLKENYQLIGDYSPALETFIEKFEETLTKTGNYDFISKLNSQHLDMDKNHTVVSKKTLEAVNIFLEGADAFEVLASELETGVEFPLSKSWISPKTKCGKSPIYKKDLQNFESQFNESKEKHDKIDEKIKNLKHENSSLEKDLARSKKRTAEFSESLKKLTLEAQSPLNFAEKFLNFFGIKYLSKGRKEKVEMIKSLELRALSVEKATEQIKSQLLCNNETLSELQSELKKFQTNNTRLKKEINKINLKLSAEQTRISNAQNCSDELRREALRLSPQFIYHSKNHPWASGMPDILCKCENSSNKIIKKVKEEIIKDSAECYNESVKNYVSTGESLLKFIVTIQAYGTIYINNFEQNPRNRLLFETNKKRTEILKELDKKINNDRFTLSNLISEADGTKEKVFLNLEF